MNMKCTWPGCCSILKTKFSLKRHVKIVHEHHRPFVCPVSDCGSAFGSSDGLKRHQRGVHTKKLELKCSRCPKTFALRNTLYRHEKFVHGICRNTEPNTTSEIERPGYICDECGAQLARKDALVMHISRKHDSNFEGFTCHHCGAVLAHKYSLKKHIFAVHFRNTPEPKTNIRCILCEKSFLRTRMLNSHYQDDHNVDLNTKTLSFSSMQEFFNWKSEMEDSTITSFRISTKYKLKDVRIYEYRCHRSGAYTEKSSDRKRAPLVRGSKKLNGVCPASIKLIVNENSFCSVTFIQTHLGHSPNDKSEMKFTFIRKEDRTKLASLVASGVPKRQIVHDQLKACNVLLRDFTKANINRNDLLSFKDLWNIETTVNVKHDENIIPSRQDNSESVEVLVNEFKESVVFYKRRGENCAEVFSKFQLKNEDLVFIFMCPSLEKLLKKHGSNIVCMDSTQGVNTYGFVLYSLLILDYDCECFPAAFVFSNRNDKMLITLFLRCIREKIGEKITPHTLMSDVPGYNVWIEEMGLPQVHKTNACMNTSNNLQNFLHTLKYLHGRGKTLEDLYSALYFIINYVKQKMRYLLGKVIFGKISPRLVALKKAHETASTKDEIIIHEINEGWLVPSFKVPKDGCEEMYVVCKIRNVCPVEEDEDIRSCYLKCTDCGECAHIYSCTCKENSARSLMCKHIHAVLLALAREKQSEKISENSEPIVQESSVTEPPVIILEEDIIADMERLESGDVNTQKEELLKTFFNVINKIETREECDIVQNYLQHMKDNLEQIRKHEQFFIED